MQQCMKLSLTNSPIGLIVLIDHAHQRRMRRDDAMTCSTKTNEVKNLRQLLE